MKAKEFFNPKTMASDIIAGITLGIESVPDGMASGLLAAVNPIHGVYGYMMGTLTGALTTSSVFMIVQAPSAMALIVAGVPAIHGEEGGIESLVALTILTGLFVAIMGLLKFGRFLRWVSNSVMVGFISGVGVLTILGQLGDLTGFDATGSNSFLKAWDLFLNLNQVVLPTFFVGMATIFLIITLEKTRLKSLGLVAAIFVASLLPRLFGWDVVGTVADIADISGSLPSLLLPPLGVFPEMILPAVSLALVAMVQGAGVSQAYANPDGEFPDADQDFVGMGISNVVSGFFQGIPVSGSFSATSLSVSSGAKTRFAAIIAAGVMAAMLLLFGDAISALALPALAGLLIVIGFRIIKPEDIKLVWNVGNVQRVVMLITFALTLLIPLQFAVFCGVALSVLMVVARSANKVRVTELIRVPGELPFEKDAPAELPSEQTTVLIPYGSLSFAAVETFEDGLPEITEDTTRAVVILSLHQRTEVGSTFLGVIQLYAEKLRDHDSRMMLAEVSEMVFDQFEKTGYMDTLGRSNIYRGTDRYLESILDALEHAEQWIDEGKGG